MTRRYFRRPPKGITQQRAAVVIDQLMQMMERGLRHPEKIGGKEWNNIFGEGSSLVAHLHKIISSMKVLSQFDPGPTIIDAEHQEAPALSRDEVALLLDWAGSEEEEGEEVCPTQEV